MKYPRSQFKVLVFGAGKMGQRHLSMMAEHPDIQQIGVYDPAPEALTPDFADRIKPTELEKRFTDFDIAIIACPTAQHFEVTRKLIEHQIPCLVEKPLTATSDEHTQIAEAANIHSTPVAVGFIERFNPALLATKEILRSNHWDRVTFSRMNPQSTRLSMDSVVSDLMIHDIDLAFNVLGESCEEINQVSAASIHGTTADYVALQYTGTSGSHVELCCSRFPGPSVRQIEASGPDGSLLIDLLRRRFYFTPRTRGMGMLGGIDTLNANPLKDQFCEFIRLVRGDTSAQIANVQETSSVQILTEQIDAFARKSVEHVFRKIQG